MEANSDIKLFLTLSQYLTGEAALDSGLAESHLCRLKSVADSDTIGKLFQQWGIANDASTPEGKEKLVGEILADSILGPLARKLILLWYTGGLRNDANTLWVIEGPADYFGALAWKVIGSHPPGLSNQFFGHWKYPTEY